MQLCKHLPNELLEWFEKQENNIRGVLIHTSFSKQYILPRIPIYYLGTTRYPQLEWF